jgi:hypothetical protein
MAGQDCRVASKHFVKLGKKNREAISPPGLVHGTLGKFCFGLASADSATN